MGILLAILAGIGLGYILERGDLCFHSTLRGLVRRPREVDLFRAYLLSLLIATPLVHLMRALGWIEPWIPPLNLQANIIGGVLFGAGMVVAATCITGLFYKLGHGMLGTGVALVAWAVGDILTYRGPLAIIRQSLQANPIHVQGEAATLLNALGWVGWVLLIGLGLATAVWLWRSPRLTRKTYWSWLPLGISVGLFTSLAWLLARAGGSDYTYGTSGIPNDILTSIQMGQVEGSPWIGVALFSIILGSFIAATHAKTLWIRGENMRRYLELGAGGLMMGIGSAISGGCNLGHSLVGVPLLSLGSIATTVSMALGVFLTHWLLQLFLERQPLYLVRNHTKGPDWERTHRFDFDRDCIKTKVV